MFWLVVIAVAIVWIVSKRRNAKTETPAVSDSAPQITEIANPAQVIAYKPTKKEAKSDQPSESVNDLMAQFVRPKKFSDAVSGMQKAIATIAQTHNVAKPDFKAHTVEH